MSGPVVNALDLGCFSVSLAVADLAASQAFYAKLGFVEVGGDAGQNWLIMRNGATTVGLFQGMFEKNLLTFNPGWDASCEPLATFTDVRDIQKTLKAERVELATEVDAGSTGPAHIVLADPDGNMILIDQHV